MSHVGKIERSRHLGEMLGNNGDFCNIWGIFHPALRFRQYVICREPYHLGGGSSCCLCDVPGKSAPLLNLPRGKNASFQSRQSGNQSERLARLFSLVFCRCVLDI